MTNLKWDPEFETKEVGICDKSLTAAIKLSEKEGIVLLVEKNEYYIDHKKIHHVLMMEPQLFKDGVIAIYANEKDLLVTGDRPALIIFRGRNKYNFYFFHNILSDNKIRIQLC